MDISGHTAATSNVTAKLWEKLRLFSVLTSSDKTQFGKLHGLNTCSLSCTYMIMIKSGSVNHVSA
jgi:hypothetical protein